MWDAFQKFTNDVSRAYGKVDKKLGGVLPGGAAGGKTTLKKIAAIPGGVMMSATEAVPAIATGMLGIDRKDTAISPVMAKAVQDAERRASARGGDKVEYSDYDSTTDGGLAARLTMGRIGMDEFKRDDQGNVTGFTQTYDTDKQSFGQAISEMTLNPKTWYKPVEGLLAESQKSGITVHDIDFENTISEPQSRPTPPAESPAMQAYEVAVGDTLTAIAAKHGLSIDEIARKNNITNVNNIGVGQQLKL